ncbi:unnamed protein product [Chondrus crispus]|uniref:Uncharacterized protein n=1 Tax=Chondrus crispus TaxID=2769 RepID=R7QMN4_CHOCR|nr:unnamed protein product [Chondrus crispus]CDF39777.1 unnamed protein product [Chondrus crispus]|eukprot:XP_005710071.1 unnamed protein product [Chondrus crispus]
MAFLAPVLPAAVRATGAPAVAKRPRPTARGTLPVRRPFFAAPLAARSAPPLRKGARTRRLEPVAVAELAADPAFSARFAEVLEFLAATTLVIPIFRRLNLSPILGFLLSGVVLGPHGLRLVKDVEDIREIADFGVLFLLFEMGLELSLDRLRKLRKYAFGMGVLQVTATAAVLGLGAYAMGGGVAESAVVGSALSLSSSAFILQILAEKGERQSRAGVATFGILLFQDIAVVPLLVLVPLLGSTSSLNPADMGGDMLNALTEGAKHIVAVLGTLNVVVLAGGAILKRVFNMVAESKSAEAFTSAVLLTVLGTALLTEELGLSMTMGSFLAGVLLAESSFRSRIKVDLEPFRGLFLGLFFVTTGMSLDVSLFFTEPGQVAFLIGSLIFWKTAICTLIGLPFGLSLAESVRVGLLLGQGGEFAFVLFALANKLGFLPDDINAFLTTTVVASMALTPLLYEAGIQLAPKIDAVVGSSGGTVTAEAAIQEVSDDDNFVLIFGYGPVGRVVGRMLSRKFIRWVAVENDMQRVERALASNRPVIFGDSQRPTEFLEANGLPMPEAFVITHTEGELVDGVLSAVRNAFPDRPVYIRAKDLKQQRDFLRKGARAMYPENFETSLQLGQTVLQGFKTSKVDIRAIKNEIRGDNKMNEVFDEYEDWFDRNMRQPSPTGLNGSITETHIASAGKETQHENRHNAEIVKPPTHQESSSISSVSTEMENHTNLSEASSHSDMKDPEATSAGNAIDLASPSRPSESNKI